MICLCRNAVLICLVLDYAFWEYGYDFVVVGDCLDIAVCVGISLVFFGFVVWDLVMGFWIFGYVFWLGLFGDGDWR